MSPAFAPRVEQGEIERAYVLNERLLLPLVQAGEFWLVLFGVRGSELDFHPCDLVLDLSPVDMYVGKSALHIGCDSFMHPGFGDTANGDVFVALE